MEAVTYADRNCFASGGVCTGLPCTRCGTGTITTRTMRSCIGCGGEILISPKIAAFAKKHGKDLGRWPSKCAACVIEVIFDSFASIDVEPLVLPATPEPQKPALVCGRGEGPCVWEEFSDRMTATGVQLRCTAHDKKDKLCAACTTALGAKFYSDVPGHGDLCLVCWGTFVKKAPTP